MSWSTRRFVRELDNPLARQGYKFHKEALDWCDLCVLLLPCNRSAHLEAGYAIGQGKQTLIVLEATDFEPELMYLVADRVIPDISGMVAAVETLQ